MCSGFLYLIQCWPPKKTVCYEPINPSRPEYFVGASLIVKQIILIYIWYLWEIQAYTMFIQLYNLSASQIHTVAEKHALRYGHVILYPQKQQKKACQLLFCNNTKSATSVSNISVDPSASIFKSTTLQDIQQKSPHWHFDTWIPGSMVAIVNHSSWFSEWQDPLMPFLPFPHPLAQVKSVNVRHTTIPSQCASLMKLKGASMDWCLHPYCHHCRVITIIILPPVTAETTSELL